MSNRRTRKKRNVSNDLEKRYWLQALLEEAWKKIDPMEATYPLWLSNNSDSKLQFGGDQKIIHEIPEVLRGLRDSALKKNIQHFGMPIFEVKEE